MNYTRHRTVYKCCFIIQVHSLKLFYYKYYFTNLGLDFDFPGFFGKKINIKDLIKNAKRVSKGTHTASLKNPKVSLKSCKKFLFQLIHIRLIALLCNTLN